MITVRPYLLLFVITLNLLHSHIFINCAPSPQNGRLESISFNKISIPAAVVGSYYQFQFDSSVLSFSGGRTSGPLNVRYTAAIPGSEASWLTFLSANTTFVGVPDKSGSVIVTVTATSTSGTTDTKSTTFKIDVLAGNQTSAQTTSAAPTSSATPMPTASSNDPSSVITEAYRKGLPVQSVIADIPFRYTLPVDFVSPLSSIKEVIIKVSTIQGEPESILPQWLVWDPSSRTFVGMPSRNTGSVTLYISVGSPSGPFATVPLVISQEGNRPPVCNLNLEPQEKFVGDTVTIQLPKDFCKDEDGDVLFYRITSEPKNVLDWLKWNEQTFTFGGKPSEPISAVIKITVDDSRNGVSSTTFDISVAQASPTPTDPKVDANKPPPANEVRNTNSNSMVSVFIVLISAAILGTVSGLIVMGMRRRKAQKIGTKSMMEKLNDDSVSFEYGECSDNVLEMGNELRFIRDYHSSLRNVDIEYPTTSLNNQVSLSPSPTVSSLSTSAPPSMPSTLHRSNSTESRTERSTAYVGQAYTFTPSFIPNMLDIIQHSKNSYIYHATLSNGNTLPSWLTINKQTGKFLGIPYTYDVGESEILVYRTKSSQGENRRQEGVARMGLKLFDTEEFEENDKDEKLLGRFTIVVDNQLSVSSTLNSQMPAHLRRQLSYARYYTTDSRDSGSSLSRTYESTLERQLKRI